uniref:Major facilitator superfamily (MFS) profile domain-containing protein n=1 Tax=Salix viminalis TaxID=40686 RepID=A0A6N2N091_SALVM
MTDREKDDQDFPSKLTVYVVTCWILAAFGGFMFGYDIGISVVQENPDFSPVLEMNLFSAVISEEKDKTAVISGAQNIWMLIIGRILLSFGVGFGNEVNENLLHNTEKICRRFLYSYQRYNRWSFGMHPYGWRVSLGLAGVPTLFLFIGSIVITETPASLIERENETAGKSTLKKIRGVDNVNTEFEQIKVASEIARKVKHPYKELMKLSSMPPLIIGIMLQVFQQLTGINVIMFYAPILFQTVGFKNDSSLLLAVITGIVNMLSTLVSIFYVDKTVIGAILLAFLTNTGSLTKLQAAFVVVLMCPIAWLIPSETFPQETRTAGFAFAISSNMIFTFLIAQAFLLMLCNMRVFIFFFFASWILNMGLFVYFLLLETKNVPIDLMVERVWKQHPV